jgi:ubiquitin carboxyl-terminal hydrolase 35/38
MCCIVAQRKAYAPESFIKVSRPSWFGAGQQQDCSEFLRHLLNVLHDQEHAVDGNEHSAPTHSGQRTTNNDEDISSLVSKTFGGYTLTTYHCLRCRTRSSKKESFMDLQLAFPAESTTSASVGSGQMAGGSSSSICRRQEADDSITENGSGSVSLTFLLDHFLQTESLEGVNQYKCEATCGSLQDAERSTQIFSAPPYLVMTLLRFSYEGGRHTKKLTDVQYPLSIEVPLAPLNDGLHESLPRSRIYGLVGVVVHSGLSSDHGHYYCYGRRSRLLSDTSSRPVMRVEGDRDSVDYFVADWFMFNDSRVTRASFEDFRNVTQKFTRDTAYLLVYHSVDEGDADSDSSEPPLHSYLREIIDRDNERYLEVCNEKKLNYVRKTLAL